MKNSEAWMKIFAIGWNGFAEARRNRVMIVLVVFAVILLLSTTLVMRVTVFTLDRVLVDVAIAAMSFVLILMSIYLTAGSFSRELRERSACLVLSAPISRAHFLIGRYLGNILTLFVLQLLMTCVFLFQMKLLKVTLTQAQVAALIGVASQLLLFSGVGIFVSCLCSQVMAGTLLILVYIVGNQTDELFFMAERVSGGWIYFLGKGLYYFLPNLHRSDFKLQASYGLNVPWAEVFSSLGYSTAYAIFALLAACIIFRRRDFH
ncbi:MAG: ABC transporter permease [Cystobacterineae bacterium]|nr:ABC transporter permease [Cystobacterineae bacterium]